jgi:CheY-like chemotaxis protein
MLSAMTTRVLIVDDHPDMAQAVRELLESQGVVVTGVASNSAEAIRLVAEQDPDAVLVDVDLGEESGFDLAERLMPATGRAWPVVLMSAHDEGDLEDLVRRSSALGFVSKARLSAGAVLELLDHGDPHVAD